LSHQGRNTWTRRYGKPIIIVFTRQQRAAIKNCLFIQARLFSIRPRTNPVRPYACTRVRACTRARVRARRSYHPARFFGLPNRCFQFSPGEPFSSLRGAGPPKKIASHFRHRGGAGRGGGGGARARARARECRGRERQAGIKKRRL